MIRANCRMNEKNVNLRRAGVCFIGVYAADPRYFLPQAAGGEFWKTVLRKIGRGRVSGG